MLFDQNGGGANAMILSLTRSWDKPTLCMRCIGREIVRRHGKALELLAKGDESKEDR